MKKFFLLLVAAFILAQLGTVGTILALILLAVTAVWFIVWLVRNFDTVVHTIIGLLPVVLIGGLLVTVLYFIIKAAY